MTFQRGLTIIYGLRIMAQTMELTGEQIQKIGDYVIEKSHLWAPRYDRDLLERSVRLEEELKNQRELMLQGFQQMDTRFESMQKQMDERFAASDRRFSDMNQRFNDMNQRFSDMNQRFDDTNRRFDDMNQHFDDINQRFDDINQRFDNTNQRFDDTNQRFDDMNKKFIMMFGFMTIGLTLITVLMSIYEFVT